MTDYERRIWLLRVPKAEAGPRDEPTEKAVDKARVLGLCLSSKAACGLTPT